MGLLEPTKPTKSKSNSTSPARRSSARSHSAPSPELLQTIQALQEELTELKSKQGMTADEKAEMEQLKTDLAEARAELKATAPGSPPARAPAREKRIVNYGTFCTVEE